MSIPYELAGRTQQKQRTRAALVTAARELVAEGLSPTVEDAAAAAEISRTTAYRYFPNQHALLAAAHPETIADSLLPEDAPSDPLARLDLVVENFLRLVLETEEQQRTMLRLSLLAEESERASLPLRQGRAIGWFTEALEPLRDTLGDDGLHRLVLAIRSATGVEALSWLTDVARIGRDDAAAILRWNAAALCRSAIAGGPPGSSAPVRRRPGGGRAGRTRSR